MRPAVSSRRREPGPGSDPAGQIQRTDLLDGRGRPGFYFALFRARVASPRDDLTFPFQTPFAHVRSVVRVSPFINLKSFHD